MGAHGEAIVQLPSGRSFDPRTGWTTVARWRGTPAAITAKAAEYQLLGLRCEIDPGTTRDDLRVYLGGEAEQSGGSEPLRDEWELDANDLQPSLWLLPKVKTELDKLSVEQASTLKTLVDKLLEGSTEYTRDSTTYTLTAANIKTWTTGLGVGFNGDILDGLIKSLAQGVEHFHDSQWVLHRVKVYASNADVRASRKNVNRIFTTAQLAQTESIPSDVKFQLEDGFWLKKSPTLKRISYGRWQITQEYWFAEAYNTFSVDPAE